MTGRRSNQVELRPRYGYNERRTSAEVDTIGSKRADSSLLLNESFGGRTRRGELRAFVLPRISAMLQTPTLAPSARRDDHSSHARRLEPGAKPYPVRPASSDPVSIANVSAMALRSRWLMANTAGTTLGVPGPSGTA